MTTSGNRINAHKRTIELLAPAKNLECGIAAIDHGADAVYIGASAFGARQAAGNSIGDIRQLAEYAHKFGAKVYVTVNTIIYERELQEARNMLEQLVNINVDAILVQDMAVVEMMEEISNKAENKGRHMPQLHASTQTDNRCKEKVEWLASVGFNRVVLARELSLEEISEIHSACPNVELEVFVHGALCVSYSGACYASQHCFRRSANRGECAQFCRLPFDLKDDNGDVICKDSHLLSLKDMKQIDRIGDIIKAGACSLKIEGRLKDITYVKNVVAAYSQCIDKFIAENPDSYRRSAYGHSEISFTPNLEKTFNRGFTHYFLDGRRDDISSFDTPKAMGEYVGYVKEIRHGSFNVAGTAIFANGDGLCFFDQSRKLEGFRVNKVDKNRLYPLTMPKSLKAGVALYRNNDMNFERAMSGKTAERKMGISFRLELKDNNIVLFAVDESGRKANTVIDCDVQVAQKPQADNISRQLEKLGNTIYRAKHITMDDNVKKLFIPSSKLATARRLLVENMEQMPIEEASHTEQKTNYSKPTEAAKINAANVANHMAEAFYEEHGVAHATCAYELAEEAHNGQHLYGTKQAATPLMTCRYCLRYAMGYCVKRGGKKPTWKEPLFLVSADGRRMKLVFNCSKCQMEIYGK